MILAHLGALLVVALALVIGLAAAMLARARCNTWIGLLASAYWAGMAMLGVVLLAARQAGWDGRAVAAVTATAAGVVIFLRRRDWARLVDRTTLTTSARVAAVLLFLLALPVVLTSVSLPENAHDAQVMWLYRARLFAEHPGIPEPPEHRLDYPHPEYPPLFPLVHSLAFEFGGIDAWAPHWLEMAAWLALAGMIIEAGRGRAASRWAALVVLVAPPILPAAMHAATDVPLSSLVLAVAVHAWRGFRQDAESHRPAPWWPMLLMTALPMAKNEGLILGPLMVASLWCAGRQWRAPVWLSLGMAAGAVPWRMVTAAHGWWNADFRIGWRVLLFPALFVDRLAEIFQRGGAILIEPLGGLCLALVLAGIMVARPARDSWAAFVTRIAVWQLGVLVVVYLSSSHSMEYHVGTSFGRVIATPFVLVATALLAAGGAKVPVTAPT